MEPGSHLTVIATYHMSPASEAGFRDLLRGHWAILERLGMVEPEHAQVFRQQNDEGITYVEIFTWKPGAVGRAHEHPEVARVWERMEDFCTAMEFPHYARVEL